MRFLNIFFLGLFSCAEGSIQTDQENVDYDQSVVSSKHFGVDTIFFDGICVAFEQIDYGFDFKGSMVNSLESEEAKIIEYNNVERHGDTLFVNSVNSFINVSTEAEGKYWRDFIFQGRVGKTDYLEVVFGEYLGYFKSILIDENTNERIETIGRVFPSPNDKFLVAANHDPDEKDGFDGLEIFVKNKNGVYQNLGKIESETWSPFRIQWLTENTFNLVKDVGDKSGKMQLDLVTIVEGM